MFKTLLLYFKIFYKFFLYFLLIVFVLILIQYLICPVYKFPKTKVFSGNKIFNPYQNIDSTKWKKANFQVQSYAWFGITDGRKNSNKAIDSIYKYLGYDIITTSDYQKINSYGNEEKTYIPVYEHGYGIRKNHQVLIGSKKVLWRDFPVFQNIHHKQHIINLLRNDNDLVYIAHPRLRGSYTTDDMKYLTNYDGIEVLNNFRTSLEHWDTALSSGHYVTILSNDDAHDITNPDEIGHRCTFINVNNLTKKNIIIALKKGLAFGADIYRPLGETFEQKAEKAKKIPIINKVKISTDTLYVELSEKAEKFRFIGQNGQIKKTVMDTKNAFYKILSEDTYIRTEIIFPDRTTFYLNPVFRYYGEKPEKIQTAIVDTYKTFIFRIISFATIIFLAINIFYFIRVRP
ncbi:MAG: hypothetical protein K8R58_03355 [Bacteroidales bacterium]|nr:hypothetical protein [Bacteroidales bacterium]